MGYKVGYSGFHWQPYESRNVSPIWTTFSTNFANLDNEAAAFKEFVWVNAFF
jgi:hypothetical protein